MLGTIYHVRNRINPHGSFHGASLVSLACTIKLKEEGEDETKQSRYPAGQLLRPVIWFSAWYTTIIPWLGLVSSALVPFLMVLIILL